MAEPVRRKPLAAACLLAGLALVLTGAAAAGNGGIAPPTPHSPNAGRISDSYYLILALTGGVFVVVETLLILFVVRFRSRGRARSVEGPQIRGNTRLELLWTAGPVVLLAVIAGFVLYKLPGIEDVPDARAAEEQMTITVNAHQFYWQFDYPGGAVSIDTLRVPVDEVVKLDIVSHDVDHSWWIPALGGKFDALPGRTNHTWFKADKIGTFRGQCGEFCGIFHASMNARVISTSRSDFERWLSGAAKGDLGRDEWVGACAKCHGLSGQGDYGPALANNPLLAQEGGLARIVTQGQGLMPPVGKGWSGDQLQALLRYVKSNVYKGQGQSSGG